VIFLVKVVLSQPRTDRRSLRRSSCRLREGSVAPDLYANILEELQRQWDDVVWVAVDEKLAGSLAKRYPLLGADAVHLAAALTLARAELPVALCSYSPPGSGSPNPEPKT
jgi:hypothetical protein